jgi:membrane-bound lytic murein transglycosylase B
MWRRRPVGARLESSPMVTVRRLCVTILALAGLFIAAVRGEAARGNDIEFSTFLAGVRQEAVAAGIRPATLDKALAGIQPIPRVLELDKKQPERTLTFAQYIDMVAPQARIDAARKKLDENAALLDEIGRKFGVQPRFIVALWAVESDFGRKMGTFPIIPALATLAYDGRRSAFFRKELINALKIVDQGHVAADAMIGSWAGAMGQTQFMPSSFLAYAYDWNGDGRRDIWGTREDALASIANYLAKTGWKGTETWGREIRLPARFDSALIGLETKKPLAFWQAAGVRRGDGGDLPARELDASLVQPGGPDGPTLLVYDNYRTVLKWNNSLYFASAVGYIADGLEER